MTPKQLDDLFMKAAEVMGSSGEEAAHNLLKKAADRLGIDTEGASYRTIAIKLKKHVGSYAEESEIN